MNRSLATAAALGLAVALAGCGGSGDEQTPPPPPKTVDLTTGQDASLAIGHADLTTGASISPACDASTLVAPLGAAAFDGVHLFVPDTDHHRVLAFSGIPTSSGASAGFAVGQLDPAPTDCTTAANAETAFPRTVRAVPAPAAGQSTLVLTDTGSNRVLLYVPSPNAAGATATVVVGQPDVDTFDPGCDAATLAEPHSAFVAGGGLFVADSGNHRVLIWDALPTADGVAADHVLGQGDFLSCDANRLSTASASTLAFPTDVWSDGTRVVVADAGNNRVQIWSALPSTDGAAASAVVGQASATLTVAAAGADGLSDPRSVTSDGTQLFVADYGNNRVLVYPSIPATGAGAAATVVLGQGDFFHVAANDANQDDVEDLGPSAWTLKRPTGLSVIDDALFVADSENDRLLVFRPAIP